MSHERLLVATSTYPRSLEDATPRFVHDLAQALGEHYRVTVLAPDAPGAQRREQLGSVEVVRLGYFRPRGLQRLAYGGGMRENLNRSPIALLQVPVFLAMQARAVRRVLRDRGIGLVNSHWMVPQGLAVAWARGRRRTFGHVLHVHAGDVYLLARMPLGRAIARYVLARVDAVFADGSDVRDRLDRLLGRPSGAALLHMGTRFEFFRRAAAEEQARTGSADFLLFLGRFVEKKGVVYLLRALPRVRREHPGLRAVLVGYGPLEEELRKETARLGLDGAVEFAGRKSHDEVLRYLGTCRVGIVPSIIDRRGETEGMPTVVIEMMAAGVRVVGSSVDGIPDVIRHGENGWLCRQKDPEDLAEKILAALRDPSPSQVVASALETARRNDWSRVAETYRRCLERLTAGREAVDATSRADD